MYLIFLRTEAASIFSSTERDELQALEQRFIGLIPSVAEQNPLMVFRLAAGIAPPTQSAYRYPVEAVLFSGPPQ